MVSPLRWREPRPSTPRQNIWRALATTALQIARTALSEPYQLTIERRVIHLRRLPPELDRFRIVQLSDLHHSPLTGRAQIERAVEIANELTPDMVALTGDYVSHEREYAAPCAEMLGRLRARCGVYAVLGNHDHWTDAPLVTDLLRAEGIQVLINEGRRFEARGGSFWLAGVDDAMVGLEDLALALAGSREDEMKLVLAHNPTILRRAARHGVDLILAGHTHGGQIAWPRRRRARRRLLQGLGCLGETQIYVSRGIGTVVLPVRYGCPPEISLLELRTA